MRQSLRALSDLLGKVESFCITYLLGLLCIIIMYQIVARNFHFEAGWTGEVAMLLSCWTTFLGAALAVKNKAHFTVDLFMGKKNRLITCMDIVVKLTIAFFVFYLVWQGFFMTYLVRLRVSGIADISMAFYFASLPISAVFMLIHMLDEAFTSREKD